jgi:hypothetical protein
MSPKKASSGKAVVVEMTDPQEKKHTTRFDNTEEGAAMTSVYISKAALKEIGNPKAVRITIEAA